MNLFPSTDLTDIFNHPSQNIAQCFALKSSFPHFGKDSFPNKNVPQFAMLDNKQSHIHFNLNSVRIVLFVVSCTKIPVD